jgi:hypothetical protein
MRYNVIEKKNKVNESLINEISSILNITNDKIKTAINELIKEKDEYKKKYDDTYNIPYSQRYDLFKIGEIVKMKADEPIKNEEYTIVRMENNCIFAVDKNNIEKKFSPEALSTVQEYKDEKEKYWQDIRDSFSPRNNRFY